MNSAIERLLGLHVRDVMATDVVTVSANSTLSEAANILRDHSVTGVPVVDFQGHCVGILSATDFMLTQSQGPRKHTSFSVHDHLENAPGVSHSDELVRSRMSRHVHTVSEHISIVNAGRLMCHEHVHRLVVLNRRSQPVGILSSLDLVSAMIHAVEE